jgi:HAD superfamily hydrolase (TIGR01509 family)
MSPNHAVKAAIFDIDGTLVDSVDLHAECWREALAHFGIDVPFEALRSQIGKGGDQLLPVFVAPDDLARRRTQIESFRSELFKREYFPAVRAFPRVRELFERLRAEGFTNLLASSAKGDELAGYKRIARIEDLVDAEVSGDDVGHSKPCPDIYIEALRRVALTADEAIAVGDSPYDAEAAGAAGVRTVGMLSGGFAEADLRRAGCVAVYRSPADLLEHLSASPLLRAREGHAKSMP